MPFFVYVKIPLRPGMAERMPMLHDEIDGLLSAQAAGALLGWGSSLSTAPDGRSTGAASHHRLDIEIADQPVGLALLADALVRLAVPDGTELHYTEDGQALQRVFAGTGWAAPTASTATSRRPRAQPSLRSLGRAR